MTTPKNKQEHIQFIAYYLIDKIQPITTKDINSGIEYWGGYEYNFKHFPELYNYRYLWFQQTNPLKMSYKMSFVMTKYTLTTLKNMLKSLDIDVEHEYKCFKNNEERFHLEKKIIMKKLDCGLDSKTMRICLGLNSS